MKPIKLMNNENVNPFQQRPKIKKLNIDQDNFNNIAQLNISPLRQKVENDAQQNLEAISACQTIYPQSNRKKSNVKERAFSVMEDSEFGAWKENNWEQPNLNRFRNYQQLKKQQNTCQFKIRQPSPKIQQQNKIINKVIQYPLTGFLERNMNQFFKQDKFLKIISNMTGATHRKKVKKIFSTSTQNSSRAQSSQSFQL